MARVTGPARGLFDGLRQLAVSQREVQITGAMKPRAPHEFWHEIGAPNEPAFQNGWTHWKDSSPTSEVHRVAFYRDPSGFVHLRGVARMAVGAGDPYSVMFHLPAGYRPSGLVQVPGHIVQAACLINIYPHNTTNAAGAGAVKISSAGTIDNAYVPLDSVAFPADLTVSVG